MRAEVPTTLRRQEVDGPGAGHHIDVLGPEVELLDAGEELAFEFGRFQLARDDAQIDHLPRGGDLQLQHHLALERRIVAQRTVVDRVDRTLVALEHELDLLDRARGLAAGTALQRAPLAGTASATPTASPTPAPPPTRHPLPQRPGPARHPPPPPVSALARRI